MVRGLLVVVAVAACGNNHAAIDAAIDAPVDTPIDTPPPPAGHYHYVIDHVDVPTNNNQARTWGLDLDNDGIVDNQLGMVLGTLSGMGFQVQADTQRAVDTGAILTLVDLYATDFTTSTTNTITTYDGANAFPAPCNGSADTACRHHLGGNAMFTVASTMNPVLAGTTVAGQLDAGPGQLEVQLAPLGAPTIKVTLVGARTKLIGTTATQIADGVIAGAITQTDLDGKVYPAMQMSMTALAQRDCCGLATSPGGATCTPPSCGCLDGSDGKTALGLFDTSPKDCTISVTEIQNNALIQALFAPDLVIDSQMALSVGFHFTAVPGAFAAP